MMNRRAFLAASAATALAGTASAAKPPKGWHVPIEDEPHERTFMQWPVTWEAYDDAEHRAAAQETIADIANTIAEFEPVTMLMGREHISAARRLLSDQVEIWDIPTDDLWCRDSGPIFMVDGKGGLAVTQVNFNGWGRFSLPNDERVAERVAERLGLPVFNSGIVGEGGGVEQDGDGTLLAHASSWVNPNRNAGSKAEVEAMLLEAYGAEKVIWAPGLIDYDVTDYHIDSLARFIEPGKVLIQVGDAPIPNDVWSQANFETLRILENATDAKGRRIEVEFLPEPQTDNWVSTYANYYICNGGVLCSTTNDGRANEEAKEVLERHYPGREVIMMETDILGEAGGGIHCSTQQMPKV